MKLVSKNTLLAAMLAAASVSAFAADSVDLKIVGNIVPPSCTPTLTGGGIIDYGNIPASTIAATGFTRLPQHGVTVTITCDSPAMVALRTIDNRAGTAVVGMANTLSSAANDTNAFGLGAVSGKQIGAYVLNQYFHPSVNGGSDNAYTMKSDDNGATWASTYSDGPGGFQRPDGSRLNSWYSGTVTPMAVTVANQYYTVDAAINSKANLPSLKQAVPLDGLATFSIVYL
ncbi:DUF1120 domain-containing protein [Paraburkholderia sp. GAS42]|jgi:type 1 fimbria pilin|uniref:DUF1120 domain-containing protein n=1 Tax=Paraburkholderia sp. GAS42 TaxID=3035135 RepID=UPI003D22BA12